MQRSFTTRTCAWQKINNYTFLNGRLGIYEWNSDKCPHKSTCLKSASFLSVNESERREMRNVAKKSCFTFFLYFSSFTFHFSLSGFSDYNVERIGSRYFSHYLIMLCTSQSTTTKGDKGRAEFKDRIHWYFLKLVTVNFM